MKWHTGQIPIVIHMGKIWEYSNDVWKKVVIDQYKSLNDYTIIV